MNKNLPFFDCMDTKGTFEDFKKDSDLMGFVPLKIPRFPQLVGTSSPSLPG